MTNKKGFTLVELSIVLVIIGMLIGGILVAQSMISTAKITSTISQLQQFDAGVINFKTKYNYLPGDAPAFGGDGDGIIDLTAASGYDNQNNAHVCELPAFWNNFDPNSFAAASCGSFGIAPVTSGVGKNVPLAKMGKNGSFFIASSIALNAATTLADTVNPRNFYVILEPAIIVNNSWKHFNNTTSSNSAVKPLDLLALDKKIDDSLANSGNVLSGSIAPGSMGIYTNPIATCSVGSTYQIQNDTYECTPLIRIGGQVGVPQ